MGEEPAGRGAHVGDVGGWVGVDTKQHMSEEEEDAARARSPLDKAHVGCGEEEVSARSPLNNACLWDVAAGGGPGCRRVADSFLTLTAHTIPHLLPAATSAPVQSAASSDDACVPRLPDGMQGNGGHAAGA